MAKTVIFTDDMNNYLTLKLNTPKLVKHAIAKTYSKSWSLIAGVDGSQITVGTDTVEIDQLPHPGLTWGNFRVSGVDVSSKGSILFITFR